MEQFIKPSAESVAVVDSWLTDNDISAQNTSTDGVWLGFNISVSKANELLDADFHVYTHAKTGKKIVRTMSYSILESLKGHLDLVHPTIT